MSKEIISQSINAQKLTPKWQGKEDAIFKEFQNKASNKEAMKNPIYAKVIIKAFCKKWQDNMMEFGRNLLQVQNKKMKIEIKKKEIWEENNNKMNRSDDSMRNYENRVDKYNNKIIKHDNNMRIDDKRVDEYYNKRCRPDSARIHAEAYYNNRNRFDSLRKDENRVNECYNTKNRYDATRIDEKRVEEYYNHRNRPYDSMRNDENRVEYYNKGNRHNSTRNNEKRVEEYYIKRGPDRMKKDEQRVEGYYNKNRNKSMRLDEKRVEGYYNNRSIRKDEQRMEYYNNKNRDSMARKDEKRVEELNNKRYRPESKIIDKRVENNNNNNNTNNNNIRIKEKRRYMMKYMYPNESDSYNTLNNINIGEKTPELLEKLPKRAGISDKHNPDIIHLNMSPINQIGPICSNSLRTATSPLIIPSQLQHNTSLNIHTETQINLPPTLKLDNYGGEQGKIIYGGEQGNIISMEKEILAQFEDECICPITQIVMLDTVIAADGRSYERAAITKWLTEHDTSPCTGLVLDHIFLIPNIQLKNIIHTIKIK